MVFGRLVGRGASSVASSMNTAKSLRRGATNDDSGTGRQELMPRPVVDRRSATSAARVPSCPSPSDRLARLLGRRRAIVLAALYNPRSLDELAIQAQIARLLKVARIDLVVLVLVVIDMVLKPVL